MSITKTINIPLTDVTLPGDGTQAAFLQVVLLDGDTVVQGARNLPLPAAGTPSLAVPFTAPAAGTYNARSFCVSGNGTTAVTGVRNQPVTFVADQVFAAPTPT